MIDTQDLQLPALDQRNLPAVGDPSFWMVPGVLTQVERIANLCKESGFFEKDNSVAKAQIKIMAGMELNMSPFEAMQSVYVTKGKIGIEAKAIAARIKSSGIYDYEIVEHDKSVCAIQFFENGKPIKNGISRITYEDCKVAGWTANTQYQTNTLNMLFYRAITFGYRRFCPNLFKIPVYAQEELVDAEIMEKEGVKEPTLAGEMMAKAQIKADNRVAQQQEVEEPIDAETRVVESTVVEDAKVSEPTPPSTPTLSEKLEATAEVAAEKGLTKVAESAKALLAEEEKISSKDTMALMKVNKAWKPEQVIAKIQELFPDLDKTKWAQQMTRTQYEQVKEFVSKNSP